MASFLRDTYGPALEAAAALCSRERPVVLFIGSEDCAICQRCQPELEGFLKDHEELDLVKLDYTQPEGLLLPHDIARGKWNAAPDCDDIQGLYRSGLHRRVRSPRGLREVLRDLRSEGCQNLYAL